VLFFTNHEYQPEIIKYFLVFLLLVFYNLYRQKSKRKIAIVHWLASGFIFAVFALVNQFFLFTAFSFSYFSAPLIVLGLLLILHLFIDRILLRRLAQREKLDLREKLSRDLHDDLASTLGSISIYAETLKGMNDSSQPENKKLPEKIAALTQMALQSVSDIIWMTSPRNDTLHSLVSKSSNYMLEILTDNKISFNAAIEIPDNPVILPEKVRNDTFLILKEGLHNVIRHSRASDVQFTANIHENLCYLSLKDNGIGIDESSKAGKRSQGNGLINMRRRAQEAGIEFAIHSYQGEGTEITMKFRI